MRTLDAVVIGAGHAGLAVSYRLAEAGAEHVVLERGEVGETWRTQRWDSFQLNTPNSRSGLPGSPFGGADPDGFMTKAEWVAALETYVREHALPVRTRVTVTAVEGDGPRDFTVATAESERIRTRSVIIASGDQNVAKRPSAARGLDPTLAVRTTGEYRRPDQLPPGAVLIVGGGQSGCQIAEDLLDAGREVYVAAGRCGRAPRRLRGRDTIIWLDEAGWFDQRPHDLPDPAMTRWPQPQISGTGLRGHTVSYQSLAARGATLLGHLEGADGARLRFADDLPAHIRFADERSAAIRQQVDDHIARSRIDAPPSDPDPADEPVADPSRYRAPAEIDLRDRGIRSVIFATGFRADLSYLRLPVLDEGGAPIHDQGRSPVDGLWFIGLTWMRCRRSGIIPGAAADSLHVVTSLAAGSAAAGG